LSARNRPGGHPLSPPGKGPGPGHKGSIFPGKPRSAQRRQLPGSSPHVLPTATATAVLGSRCLLPPLLWQMPAWPLREAAGWMRPLLLQDSSAAAWRGPVFAFEVVHKHQPGWPPCGAKVCPWAEPRAKVSSSCRAVPEEPSSTPAPSRLHPSTIPAPSQCHPSSIPAPTQLHPSSIPAPLQCHPSSIPAPSQLQPSSIPASSQRHPSSIPAPLQCHPSSIPALSLPPGTATGTSSAGDTGFPARGIPHRAKPWLAAGCGPAADRLCRRRCSLPLLALPLCTSLTDARQPPGLPSLAPALLQPLRRPRTLGSGGRGGGQHRPGGSRISADPGAGSAPPATAKPVADKFPAPLWAPAKGKKNPRRWEGPAGLQPGFLGQARWELRSGTESLFGAGGAAPRPGSCPAVIALAQCLASGWGLPGEGGAGGEGSGSSPGGCRGSFNPFSEALALPFPWRA